MSIIKRALLRKTFIALGGAAAIGGATASTGYAEAVSGFFDSALVGSPASATNPAVATNPGGPGAAANSFNSGAAKTLAGAKDPSAAENPGAEVDPWESLYVDN